MIRAGTVAEVSRESGEWLFIDIGFSSGGESCGVLFGEGEPAVASFADLKKQLVGAAELRGPGLNVTIEAPLSVAFNSRGNPTGRKLERQGAKTRYWYVGLGCAVLSAATYLLRELAEARIKREVRLFEGFVSFKTRGARSCHVGDVRALREVVWHPNKHPGQIVPPDQLAQNPSDEVFSAFRVAGMDFGVPPVIRAMANPALQPAAGSSGPVVRSM